MEKENTHNGIPLSLKRKKDLLFATTRTDLDGIMLNKISQKQKEKYHRIKLNYKCYLKILTSQEEKGGCGVPNPSRFTAPAIGQCTLDVTGVVPVTSQGCRCLNKINMLTRLRESHKALTLGEEQWEMDGCRKMKKLFPTRTEL